MMAPADSTPMNRQAVPSIVLSVSIVCFFAVALYRRDPGTGRSARTGVTRPSVKHREATTSAWAGTAAANRAAGPVGARTGAIPELGAAASGRPSAATASIPPNERVRAVRAEAIPLTGGARIGDGAARPTDLEPPPAIRVASSREGPAGRSPSPSPPAVARAPGVRLAHARFTIVGSGETITDVARRVYGSADGADMLWRANRDVVGAPGEPLSPGTVLRTPARTGR